METHKIKILYIITGLEIGGAEILLLNIVKNLNKDLFNCSILYLKGKADIGGEFSELNIDVYNNSRYSFFNPYKYWKIFNLIKQKKIDIVHSHLIHSNLIARIIGKASNVKVIINSEHNTSNWKFKYIPFIILFRITLRYVNLVHCISNSVRDHILSIITIDNSKLKVIYNGICLDRFKNNKFQKTSTINYSNSHPIIGCVSRLDKRKGIEYLIKAIGLLKVQYKDIKLILVGDGPQRSFLNRLVKELSLVDQVVFVGKTFEVEKYLSIFDFFVLPSLQEGLSIAIIEAMASGVPVIASNVGGIPEVITHKQDGILIKAKNENDIFEAVIQLNNDKKLKSKLISNAYDKISAKFDIRKIVKEFESMYTHYINKIINNSL